MTALQRAQDLFCNVKRSQLPPLARDYHDAFCRRVGLCGEMSLTAFAAYAEIVEGLPADDPEYAAEPDARAWFEARLQGAKP